MVLSFSAYVGSFVSFLEPVVSLLFSVLAFVCLYSSLAVSQSWITRLNLKDPASLNAEGQFQCPQSSKFYKGASFDVLSRNIQGRCVYVPEIHSPMCTKLGGSLKKNPLLFLFQ